MPETKPRKGLSPRNLPGIGRTVSAILSARWWIGLGVLATVIIGVRGPCVTPPPPPESGWSQHLTEDLKQLPKEPVNSLRVGEGEVHELARVDRLLFHEVVLEQGSTLELARQLPVQELRAGRIELHPGASILGSGVPGAPGAAGTAGINGGRCTDGQPGTDGDPGGDGRDGVAVRLEALELATDGIVTIDTSAGGGGAGGAGGAGGSGGRGDRSEDCDGGDGGGGGNGGDGGSGGSAGDLRLRFGEARSLSNEKLLSDNDLRRMVVHIAHAGIGGAQGGEGAGGAGGRGRGSNVFRSADPGSRGSNGQRGARGEDGRSGTTTFGDAPVEQVP